MLRSYKGSKDSQNYGLSSEGMKKLHARVCVRVLSAEIQNGRWNRDVKCKWALLIKAEQSNAEEKISIQKKLNTPTLSTKQRHKMKSCFLMPQ